MVSQTHEIRPTIDEKNFKIKKLNGPPSWKVRQEVGWSLILFNWAAKQFKTTGETYFSFIGSVQKERFPFLVDASQKEKCAPITMTSIFFPKTLFLASKSTLLFFVDPLTGKCFFPYYALQRWQKVCTTIKGTPYEFFAPCQFAGYNCDKPL